MPTPTQLSPEILTMIAGYLSTSSLAAFSLSSKALARVTDPFRFRRVNVRDGLELDVVCRAIASRWRDVGRHVVELTIGDEQSALGRSPLPESITSLAGRICYVLGRSRNVTSLRLTIRGLPTEYCNDILRAVITRRLRYFALDTHSPLPAATLAEFLYAQPHIYHLSIPGQEQAFPPNGSDRVVDEQAMDDRASQWDDGRVPPQQLPHLHSVCAPASFILSLPSSSPLRHVTITGSDLRLPDHRRLCEYLGQSPGKVTHLDIPLHEDDFGLGSMQEITNHLRDLMMLQIRGVAKKAYFTFFLQDVTGCLSRCKNLRMLAFQPPTDPARLRPASLQTPYVSLPSADPSIPLPPLLRIPAIGANAQGNLSLVHVYPPNGPDLFRREQYYVNLFSRTNPKLRSVTMPAGTRWRWSQDVELNLPHLSSSPFTSSPFPEHRLKHNILPALPEIPQRSTSRRLTIVVSSTTPSPSRHLPDSPCYGWEPDKSFTAAREWWELSGFKPLSPCPSDDTEVESESDLPSDEEEPTDVEGSEDSSHTGRRPCGEDSGCAMGTPRGVGCASRNSISSQILEKEPVTTEGPDRYCLQSASAYDDDAHLPPPPMILASQRPRGVEAPACKPKAKRRRVEDDKSSRPARKTGYLSKR